MSNTTQNIEYITNTQEFTQRLTQPSSSVLCFCSPNDSVISQNLEYVERVFYQYHIPLIIIGDTHIYLDGKRIHQYYDFMSSAAIRNIRNLFSPIFIKPVQPIQIRPRPVKVLTKMDVFLQLIAAYVPFHVAEPLFNVELSSQNLKQAEEDVQCLTQNAT